MTYYTTTTTEAPAFADNDTTSRELSLYASTPASSVVTGLTDSEHSAIDRFCDQCLQLEPRPHYPDGNLLKRAEVQVEICDRICADGERLPPGNARLQLGVLKELASRIQTSISEEESDDYVRLVPVWFMLSFDVSNLVCSRIIQVGLPC